MELHVEMQSADTDVYMEEQSGSVGVQLRVPEVWRPTRDLWQHKWTASNAHFDHVFLSSDFGHEYSVCDNLWLIEDLTKVTNKHVDVLW
jgi:hypothetical protein